MVAQSEDTGAEGRDESKASRLDRNYSELLQELRVAETVVRITNRLALAATSFLLLAVLGGVLLIFDYVVGREFAAVATGLLAVVFIILWLVLPLSRLRAEENRHG